jgi:hypothetical protein
VAWVLVAGDDVLGSLYALVPGGVWFPIKCKDCEPHPDHPCCSVWRAGYVTVTTTVHYDHTVWRAVATTTVHHDHVLVCNLKAG